MYTAYCILWYGWVFPYFANFNYSVNFYEFLGDSRCNLSVVCLHQAYHQCFTQTVGSWAWFRSLIPFMKEFGSKMIICQVHVHQPTDEENKSKQMHLPWFPRVSAYLFLKISIWHFTIPPHMKLPHIPWTSVFQKFTVRLPIHWFPLEIRRPGLASMVPRCRKSHRVKTASV